MKSAWIILGFLSSALYGATVVSGTGIHINPNLVISPDSGRAVTIWTENSNRIEAAYFNGASWLNPIIIGNGSFPQVGIDANGNALAVWLNTSNSQVLSSRFDPNAVTWSTPLQLSTDLINASPQIAVNKSGNALAVWVSTNPTQLKGSSFNASTMVWSTPVALVTGTGSFPQVALDNGNKGIVMWTDTSAGIVAATVSIR